MPVNQIQSGATNDLWTIDPVSKAGRVTLYDATGTEINSVPSQGQYSLPVGLRLSAALSAGSTVFIMRPDPSSTKTVFIRRIMLMFAFDGTPEQTSSRWEIIRTSASGNPTGGTVVVPAKRRTSWPASTIGVAMLSETTALVTSGTTFEPTALAYGGCARQNGSTNLLRLTYADHRDAPQFRVVNEPLNLIESLAIRTKAASVGGDSCLGVIEWDER